MTRCILDYIVLDLSLVAHSSMQPPSLQHMNTQRISRIIMAQILIMFAIAYTKRGTLNAHAQVTQEK